MSLFSDALRVFLSKLGLIDPASTSPVYKFTCPFHDDSMASAIWNYPNDSFYCFACGRSYDAMDIAKLAYPELDTLHIAIKIASASNAHIHLPTFRKRSSATSESARFNAQVCYDSLPTELDTKSPGYRMLIGRGYRPKALKLAGLRHNMSDSYDAMFPIHDILFSGFEGWVCRSSSPSSPRKYLYNTGFAKSHVVHGLLPPNSTPRVVFVAEGYLDWLALWQHPLTHREACCCIFGWKPSNYQLDIIESLSVPVCVCLDNTETGDEGAELFFERFPDATRFPIPDFAKDMGDLAKSPQHISMGAYEVFKHYGVKPA